MKEQAADVNNDGTPEGAYGAANISLPLRARAFVIAMTVTNIGTTQVTDVVDCGYDTGFHDVQRCR